MTPLLTKALIGSGVVGVTAGCAGAIYLMSNSSEKKDKKNEEKTNTKFSISSLLAPGKRLLTKDSSDNSKWTDPWNKFKQANNEKAPEKPWSFATWDADKGTDKGFSSFKAQCLKLGETAVEGVASLIFKAVDAHCTTTV